MTLKTVSHAPQQRARSRASVLLASVLTTLLLLFGTSAAAAQAAPSDSIVFSDAALEGCIRESLGIFSPTPVTEGDMGGMLFLQCRESGVTDLSVLQYATQLISLELAGNQVSDLSPLAGLTKLDTLYLFDNQVSDVSPLAGLTSLTLLDISYSQVSDLSPLAELKSLEYLTLSNSKVSDVSPLSGLENLRYLALSSNDVSDISPLGGLTNLTQLIMPSNRVSDVSPLAQLTKLELLMMSSNQVADITPLVELANLNYLYLEGQVLPAGSAVVGVPSPVPEVLDPDGNAVPVEVISGSGEIVGGHALWTVAGTSSLGWLVSVKIGNTTTWFSGDQSITVSDAPVHEITLSGTPVDGSVGMPYSFAYALAGTPAPGVYVSSGSLPSGLTLASDGIISGTPTVAGKFEFTVTASNGSAPDVSVESMITISNDVTHPPVEKLHIDLEFPERLVGQTQTVTGVGFSPGAKVVFELHSTPVVLGSVAARSDGTVSYSFVVPGGTAIGDHQIVATDVDGRAASASFVVLEAPRGDDQVLAVAGGESLYLASVAGVVLLIAGGILLRLRRSA